MDYSKARNQNLVVIREDHFVDRQRPPPPPPSTLPEDSPPQLPSPESSEPPSPAAEAAGRFCEILKARVISGISRFRRPAADSLRSVFSVTAMAALLVVSLFWFKTRLLPWRSRPITDNQRPLLLQLQRKDEKISQLLQQIAQMNEILSARRRVPVVRIK